MLSAPPSSTPAPFQRPRVHQSRDKNHSPAHKCTSHARRLLVRPPPPAGEFLTELDALSGPLAGPAKPPELVKFNTSDTVGAAMRVRKASFLFLCLGSRKRRQCSCISHGSDPAGVPRVRPKCLHFALPGGLCAGGRWRGNAPSRQPANQHMPHPLPCRTLRHTTCLLRP